MALSTRYGTICACGHYDASHDYLGCVVCMCDRPRAPKENDS